MGRMRPVLNHAPDAYDRCMNFDSLRGSKLGKFLISGRMRILGASPSDAERVRIGEVV